MWEAFPRSLCSLVSAPQAIRPRPHNHVIAAWKVLESCRAEAGLLHFSATWIIDAEDLCFKVILLCLDVFASPM